MTTEKTKQDKTIEKIIESLKGYTYKECETIIERLQRTLKRVATI